MNMIRGIIIGFMSLCPFFILSQHIYSELIVNVAKPSALQKLIGLDFDLDHPHIDSDGWITLYMVKDELLRLQESDLDYQITIEDYGKHYLENIYTPIEQLPLQKEQRTADNFGYGSMGGFYTLSEIEQKLDDMETLFPSLVKQKFSIGSSHEGRPIWAVKISDNADVAEDEPAVYYDALHHAREPLSMAVTINYMFWLLENYATDPQVNYIINNRELYFVPVVNPDGYEYNRSTNPSGGGLWRKNRRDNSGSCEGVDLNRNYSVNFGLNDTCSSPNTCSNVYRGPNAFSEPESAAVKAFTDSIQAGVAFSTHSTAGNFLMPDPGIAAPFFDIYSEWATDFLSENDYPFGTTIEMLNYSSCGQTRTYLHVEGTYAWTPEIDGSGFWPDPSEIFSLVDENVYPLFYQSWIAGGYANLQSHQITGEAIAGSSFDLGVEVKNKGVESTVHDVTVTVETFDPLITVSGIQNYSTIPARTKMDNFSNPFTISIGAGFSQASFVVDMVVMQGGVETNREPITIFVGSKTVLFSDDSEITNTNWTSSGSGKPWTYTTDDSYGGLRSICDSDGGNGVNNSLNQIELTNALDISNTNKPILEFMSKWSIENGDVINLEVSTDNGSNYTTIKTFEEAEPWHQEIIDLSAYKFSSQLKLKFSLDYDSSIPGDGFYFDDLSIIDFDCASCPVCPIIDFTANSVIPYDPTQDAGTATIEDNGATVFLEGNAWKAVDISYTVTANTVIQFDFKSTVEGEIHELGFDGDLVSVPDERLVVYGNQGYGGTLTNPTYTGNGNWQSFVVQLGDQFTGTYTYLVLTADDDGSAAGNSYFRNVSLFEDEDGDFACDVLCVVGETCDDGDVCTIGEMLDSNCNCVGGIFQDADNDGFCDAVDVCPNMDDGLIGQACDDGDICTVEEVYDANCNCSGGLYADSDNDSVCDPIDLCPGFDDLMDEDFDGIPDGCDDCNNMLLGQSCDDGDVCTVGETFDENCACMNGTFLDADDDGVCDAWDNCPGFDDGLIGEPCDDGDICTVEEVYDTNCYCSGGLYVDSDNDGVCDPLDVCPGFDDLQDEDSDYIPDGCDACNNMLIGQSCDDGDACTVGETYTVICDCDGGIFLDSDNDGICDAEDNCTSIYSDDFELDSGIWVDGGQDAERIMSGFSPAGNYSMLIRDNSFNESSIYTIGLDLSSFDNVQIKFLFQAIGMEIDEEFYLEVSTDGGQSYTLLQLWRSGIEFSNDVVYSETIDIASPFLQASTIFRFKCNASINSDEVFLDNIVIETCQLDCPDYNIASSNVTESASQSVQLGIESNNIIPANSQIDYTAGQYILLTEGFEVESMAVFHAYIEACQD